MSLFISIECKDFYISCERVFNPSLENAPVIIICPHTNSIIACSAEAKKLGFVPHQKLAKWEPIIQKRKVHILKFNYALYADMSQRLINACSPLSCEIEIYSLDSLFLTFKNFAEHDINLPTYAAEIRKKIKQWIGLTLCLGIGPTKTLAKIANEIAKNASSSGILNFCDEALRKKLLLKFPVTNLWKLTPAWQRELNTAGIIYAHDLMQKNYRPRNLKFRKILEKIANEMNGQDCLPLSLIQPDSQLRASYFSPTPIKHYNKIQKITSQLTKKLAAKLRKNNKSAKKILIFMPADQETYQGHSLLVQFSKSLHETDSLFIAIDNEIKKIFNNKCCYQKIELFLIDVVDRALPKHIFDFDQFKVNQRYSTLISPRKKLPVSYAYLASCYSTNWKALPCATA